MAALSDHFLSIQSEEKIKAFQERLELAEQKLSQFSNKGESPGDGSEEARNKLDALTQVSIFLFN